MGKGMAAIAFFLPLVTQLAAQSQPPAILQIYREALKPGVEAEYDRIESDTARKCAELRCPHAYLGVESLTGPKEIWWFNAYDSVDERKRVADAWAKNRLAFSVLGRNSKRKARLTDKGVNVFADYRQDLSAGPPWLMGHRRYLVISVTRSTQPMNGTVFESDDGTQFFIVAVQTREEATSAAAARTESRVFAVRPLWSYPAEEWIGADPDFWLSGHPSNR